MQDEKGENPFSIPTGRLLGLPNDTQSWRRFFRLEQLRCFHDGPGPVRVLDEFGAQDARVVPPLPSAIVKLSHTIQIVSLVFEGNAPRPFFPKLANVHHVFGLHHIDINKQANQQINSCVLVGVLQILDRASKV